MNVKNYPNPAREYSNIKFNLPNNGKATVKLYNITGQKLDEKVIDGKEGSNIIKMDLSDYPSGLYFYQVKTGKTTSIGRISHLK